MKACEILYSVNNPNLIGGRNTNSLLREGGSCFGAGSRLYKGLGGSCKLPMQALHAYGPLSVVASRRNREGPAVAGKYTSEKGRLHGGCSAWGQ